MSTTDTETQTPADAAYQRMQDAAEAWQRSRGAAQREARWKNYTDAVTAWEATAK